MPEGSSLTSGHVSSSQGWIATGERLEKVPGGVGTLYEDFLFVLSVNPAESTYF